MSREQGPREAGMRPAANVAGRRRHGMTDLLGFTEASDMSREMATAQRGAGAPLGMRPAKAIGRRRHGVLVLFGLTEATHA